MYLCTCKETVRRRCYFWNHFQWNTQTGKVFLVPSSFPATSFELDAVYPLSWYTMYNVYPHISTDTRAHVIHMGKCSLYTVNAWGWMLDSWWWMVDWMYNMLHAILLNAVQHERFQNKGATITALTTATWSFSLSLSLCIYIQISLPLSLHPNAYAYMRMCVYMIVCTNAMPAVSRISLSLSLV